MTDDQAYRTRLLERSMQVKIGSKWLMPDGTPVSVWAVTNLNWLNSFHAPVVILKEDDGFNYYSIMLEIFPFDLKEVKDEN